MRTLDSEFLVELRAWDIPAMEAAVAGSTPLQGGLGWGPQAAEGLGSGRASRGTVGGTWHTISRLG